MRLTSILATVLLASAGPAFAAAPAQASDTTAVRSRRAE